MLALLSRRLVKKRETHNEKQQALNNMFAKRLKSKGNNTTTGIMDVQILVKPLPMTQCERENNKHSYETFQKYIQHTKEGEKYAYKHTPRLR